MQPLRGVRSHALCIVALALLGGTLSPTPASAGTAPAAPAAVPTATPAADSTARAFEQEVLRLTNNARKKARKCGSTRYKAAPRLRWDARLAKAAVGHSQEMATYSYFSHTSRDGRSPFARIKQAGFRYDSAGENIAAGFNTPASVVSAWLKSPGHCRNVMRRGFTHLGVGFASGGFYGSYWTQDFGNPR